MDSVLYDELIIEIFHRLPPPSNTVSLVSKRWRRLYRHSKTSLSLLLPPPRPRRTHHFTVVSLVSQYPFLTSLSLSSTSSSSSSSSETLLLSAVGAAGKLKRLRFHGGGVSFSTLFSLSSSSSNLTSLTIPVSRPLDFSWVGSFPSLTDLSVFVSSAGDGGFGNGDVSDPIKLKLQSISVSGLSWSDLGMGWLWRNSPKLKKLHLRSCESVGDGGSFADFSDCLTGLTEVELRSCRTISATVLHKLATNSPELNSLLVYDGGSKEGLRQFIINSKSNLKKLDLRLPLDLNNDHLTAMADHLKTLTTLRLQSCCLVTGDGLKTLTQLEELALINCDVVERVPGLLTTLGQNLKKLRKLDLSHNEDLGDKELVSMLVSCEGIVELRVKGCRKVTNMAAMAAIRVCRDLERVDLMQCDGVDDRGVDVLVMNLGKLKEICVEEGKVSEGAKYWVRRRCIHVGGP